MSEELKPNSNKYKKEQREEAAENKKTVEKVVSGNVRTKKKSGASKFADVFISEDATNVKSYILMEVLVPAVKKAVSDIVTDGIDMILYGSTGKSRKNSSSRADKVSYRSYYDDRRDDRRDRYSSSSRAGYDFDDILLDTRGDAEEVLYRMDELLDSYKCVSVADMYDLVGISGNYTDNKYGWTNLATAKVERVRDGYILKLPRPKPL